jgi:hypothetical protein
MMQVFDIRAAISETIYCHRLAANLRNLQFNFKVDAEVPQKCLFDKFRLQ